MLKKITYPAILVLWMVMAVSCKKETVTPCNPANGSNYTLPELRDGEGGVGTVDPTDPSGTNSDSTATTNGDGEDEGITDGGGSSEADSKTRRKKP